MITNALEKMTAALEQKPAERAFRLHDGDCGLVIRKDGEVQLFQQGICIAGLQKEHGSMSTEDKQALLNGQTLMVLSIVAGSPELQQTILAFATNQGAVDIPVANGNAK
ncbi:hypothetical protein HJA82_29545 [Rhizobium bangladeshense]|uniref:hypothetical protein n=1 Tax=Rhizobium bangladeshense TaxID=1138189 RepID=UPI001C83203F|nr:hypothetical protein [Rhizobium bangladeshense]MBX4911461.1 hypothetical protein [Rhizobium bangladeshense]